MLRTFEILNKNSNGMTIKNPIALADDQLFFLQRIFALWVGINVWEPDGKVWIGVVIGQLKYFFKSF